MSYDSIMCKVPNATAENALFFFNEENFDEDPNCFSPLSCEAVPNCVRRILPVEIKMNSIHKQRFLQ